MSRCSTTASRQKRIPAIFAAGLLAACESKISGYATDNIRSAASASSTTVADDSVPTTIPGDSSAATISGSNPVSILKGKVLYSASSAASALALQDACSPAIPVALVQKTKNGNVKIADAATKEDGSYEFQAYESALGGDAAPTLIVQAKPCGGMTLERLVNGSAEQTVSIGTSYVVSAAVYADRLDKIDASDLKKLYEKLEQIEEASKLDVALRSQDLTLANSIESVFGLKADQIMDVPPRILDLIIPEQIVEGKPNTLRVSLFHWNPSYQGVVNWMIDGVLAGTGPSWIYIPNGDAQGPHTITVYVGAASAGKTSVDTGRPYIVRNQEVVIANDVLPTAPPLALKNPAGDLAGIPFTASRAVQVDVTTGKARANCDDFHSFALTESAVTPPAAAFTGLCTAENIQTEAFDLVGGTDGPKSIYLWAMDSAGTVSAKPSATTFILDTTAPTIASALPVGGTAFSTANISLDVQAADAGLNSTLKIAFAEASGSPLSCHLPDSPTWRAYSGSVQRFDITLSNSDGLKTICVWAKDGAGWISAATTVSATLDTTAPTIASLPLAAAAADGWINLAERSSSSNLVATPTLPLGAGISYAIRPSGTACTPSLTYESALPTTTNAALGTDGSYHVCAKIFDDVGNASYTTSSTFVVDTVLPTVDAGADRSARATIALNASVSGATLLLWEKVSPSAAGSITWSSPSTAATNVSASAEGTYTLRLTATDAAGNSASDTLTLTWDTTAPTVDAGADTRVGSTFTRAATVGSDTASVAWSKDSGPSGGVLTFGSSTSASTTIQASVDGAYQVRATATDALGNSQYDTFTLTWDTTAPTLSQLNLAAVAADGWVNLSEQGSSVALLDAPTVPGDAAISYALCAAGTTCGPSLSYGATIPTTTNSTLTTEGSYHVCAKLTDDLGNASYTTSATFVVDRTPPTVNAGSDVSARAQVALNASVSGASTLLWEKITPSAQGTITWSSTSTAAPNVSASAEGNYTLRLTATDAAGNSASDDLVLTWDTTGPTVDAGADASAKVSFTRAATVGSDTASVLWSKDSGPSGGVLTFGSATAASTTIQASTDGVYQVRVTVTDALGNSQYDTFALTWDTTGPSSAISSATPASPSSNDSPTIAGTTEAGASVSLYLTSNCSGSAAATVTAHATTGAFSAAVTVPTNAATSISAKATDSLGNGGSCSSAVSYRHDDQNPSNPGTPSWTRYWASTVTSPTLSWAASTDSGSGVASYKVALGSSAGAADVATWVTVTSGTTYQFTSQALAVGTSYYATVQAVDAAGNMSGVVSSAAVKIIDAPTVQARYAAAPNWNDYVRASSTTTVCDGTEDLSSLGSRTCLHGGELRKVTLTGISSCAGLTMADTVGAFNWICQVQSGTATFYSGGLKETAGLASLVTETAFRSNSVTVYDQGTAAGSSSASVWWNNTVMAAPSNTGATDAMLELASAGTIYTIASSRDSRGYSINADKISLVTLGSAVLTYAGTHIANVDNTGETSGTLTDGAFIAAASQKFVWIEGTYKGYGHYGAGTGYGIYLNSVRSSTLWRVNLRDFDYANLNIWGSDGNRIVKLRNSHGLYVGILMDWADFNLFYDTEIDNPGQTSVHTYLGYNNDFVKLVVSGFSWWSFDVCGNYWNVSHATAAMGGGPFWEAQCGSNATLNSILTVDVEKGLEIASSTANNRLHNIAIMHGDKGLRILGTASNINMTGNLILGNNATQDCEVTSTGASIGVATSDCSAQNGASFTRTTSASLSSTFVGRVTTDDSVNGGDTNGLFTMPSNGTALRAQIASMDLFGFESPFRMLYREANASYLDATNRGHCFNTDSHCRIGDFRLKSSDTVVRNKSGYGSYTNDAFIAGQTCPKAVNGNATMTDYRNRTFLTAAVEVMFDGLGNDDGFCNSGEACIYSPNIGAYQGEGDYLSNSCTFEDGTVTGVTMYAYPTNGVP